MNLPTLKVMACPVNAGRHPYHNNRWIVTSDAEIEWNTNETEWRLKSGSLICEMRDCQNQEQLARLFSSAPELLEALEKAYDAMKWHPAFSQPHKGGDGWHYSPEAVARVAILKARGES